MTKQFLQRAMWAAALLAVLSMVLSACGGGAPQANDLLGEIKQRGKLRVSTDPNYAPQSFLNDQGELDGFDVDVAKEVAKRLGVEVEFTTPDWDLITSGNWGGRWDVSIGSMTITGDRKKALYFSSPYYYTPAQFAARADAGITQVDDFSGRAVCTGASTTYESYIEGTLSLEGETIIKQVKGIELKTYSTDQECIQAIQAGRKEFDGVLTAAPTVEEGIKAGAPIVKVGDPVYYEALAAAMDKSATLSSQTLVDAISKAIDGMHQDGTLTKLSVKWYGIDLTKKK
jgi:polar amino acid transport system substrate-binding protein